MASNATQLGLGALAAVVVGVGVVLFIPQAPLNTPEPQAQADDVVAKTTEPEVEAEVAAEPEPEVSGPAPTFDTFRIEPDGNAVVAGRAMPGQIVDIELDGDVLIRVGADAAGSFVALLTLDESADPRVLRLRADPDGEAILSAETIIVAPFGTMVADPAQSDSVIIAGAVTAAPDAEQSSDPEATVAELPDLAVSQAEDAVAEVETEVAPDSEATAVAEATIEPAPTAQIQSEETATDDSALALAGEAAIGTTAAISGSVVEAGEDAIAALTIDDVDENATAEVAEAGEPDTPLVEDVETAAADPAPEEIVETETDVTTDAPQDTAEVETTQPLVTAVPKPDVAVAAATQTQSATEDAQTVAVAEPAEAPASPPVLIADADGVRVLPGPEVMAAVALDTITYDPSGDVVLAGRARSDGFVQVYIDNQPITTSRITAGGDWRTDLPQVDTGIYTLRIDEVADDGTVVSRIETPFKREEPEAVAAVMAQDTAKDGFDVAVRTVQPGATLWAIAKEELGEGIMYVAVYEANRDLIRNPDLIYPGQVFRIPDATE